MSLARSRRRAWQAWPTRRAAAAATKIFPLQTRVPDLSEPYPQNNVDGELRAISSARKPPPGMAGTAHAPRSSSGDHQYASPATVVSGSQSCARQPPSRASQSFISARLCLWYGRSSTCRPCQRPDTQRGEGCPAHSHTPISSHDMPKHIERARNKLCRIATAYQTLTLSIMQRRCASLDSQQAAAEGKAEGIAGLRPTGSPTPLHVDRTSGWSASAHSLVSTIFITFCSTRRCRACSAQHLHRSLLVCCIQDSILG